MKTLPIYTYGFEILRKKTRKVTKIDDKFIQLVQNMFYTMRKANGVGLAAPQIGLDYALTVIDVSSVEGEEEEKPLILINPKVIDSHGEIVIEEGCLSIPTVRWEVERPEKVYIEYQDLDLNKKNIELDGFMGRVSQHEIDHLNGVLFIDHLEKETKKQLKQQLDLIKKGGIQASYVLAEVKPTMKKTSKKSELLARI
jgi:peptide deformylase